MGAGCARHGAFPELENEGTLTADEQNVIYDDSSFQAKKEASLKSEKVKSTTMKKEAKNEPVKLTVPEKTKDLTIPDKTVADIPENDVVIPGKTTPMVIDDMDLEEMDAGDSKQRVIKPVTETKTVLSTKKEQKVVETEQKSAEPSVFYLAETIYFSNGGSTVESKYLDKMRKIVKEAKSHGGKIIVQGFASSRTRDTDIVTHKMTNLRVSTARAESVAKLLIKYGMPKNRVITEGLSDSRPVYQEVMPEGERLNRRAEIYISY